MISCNGCKNRNTYKCVGCVGWNKYESNTLMNPILAIDISKEMKLLDKAEKLAVFAAKHHFDNLTKFDIEKVIFNYPATIVMWADGTKTVVKAGDYDIFDPEKGLAMAIAKKALGNQGNYYEVFKKWLPEGDTPRTRVQASAMKLTGNGMFSASVDFQDTDGLCDECVEAVAKDIVDRLSSVTPALKPDTTISSKEVLLSPEELAEKLGLSVATIHRRCREGQYPGANKVGGKWKIPYYEEA